MRAVSVVSDVFIIAATGTMVRKSGSGAVGTWDKRAIRTRVVARTVRYNEMLPGQT